MSDLTPKARALLHRAARAHEPTDADRARVRARIARRLAVGAAAAGTATVASKPLSAAGGGLLTKALLSLAVVGTVSAGAATLVSQFDAPRPAVSVSAPSVVGVSSPAVEAAPAVAPPASPVDDAPVASSSSPRKAVPRAPAIIREPTPASTPNATADPVALSDEVDLLARAHEALGRADGHLALALLEEHARRFPKSALAEERAAVRVFALCESGRRLDGTREAARFLGNHPRSPLADRVRSSCGSP